MIPLKTASPLLLIALLGFASPLPQAIAKQLLTRHGLIEKTPTGS